MWKKGGKKIEKLNIFCTADAASHFFFILLSQRLRLCVSSFSSFKQMLEQYNKKGQTRFFSYSLQHVIQQLGSRTSQLKCGNLNSRKKGHFLRVRLFLLHHINCLRHQARRSHCFEYSSCLRLLVYFFHFIRLILQYDL